MGIIPAYAGNTFSVTRKAGVWKDHPRVCGEHQKTKLDNTATKGIIPAYAGNTMASSPVMMDWRDHPRVCGEHNSEGYQRSRRQGSSPRMRGTLCVQCHSGLCLGIIPAYAGNTLARACI